MGTALAMTAIAPNDPAFQARIQASFGRQGLMRMLGAYIMHISPWAVDIALPVSPSISQHGFIHAGAVAAIGGHGRWLCRAQPDASTSRRARPFFWVERLEKARGEMACHQLFALAS